MRPCPAVAANASAVAAAALPHCLLDTVASACAALALAVSHGAGLVTGLAYVTVVGLSLQMIQILALLCPLWPSLLPARSPS